MSHCISAVLWLTTATFFFYIFPVNCVMAMSHRFEREIGLTKDRMTHSTKTQHNEENDEASKKKKWKRKKKRKTLTESKRRNKMKLMTDWNPPKAMNESEAERRMRVCERLGAKDERSKWCYLMSLSFYCIETWPSSTEKKLKRRWTMATFRIRSSAAAKWKTEVTEDHHNQTEQQKRMKMSKANDYFDDEKKNVINFKNSRSECHSVMHASIDRQLQKVVNDDKDILSDD